MSRFPINRRHALQTIGAAAAGAATSSSWVESLVAFTQQQTHSPAAQAASAAAGEWTPRILTPKQNEAVVILTELIIPETDTPGAKAARVNRFVDGCCRVRNHGIGRNFCAVWPGWTSGVSNCSATISLAQGRRTRPAC